MSDKDTSVIPPGLYCYTPDANGFDSRGRMPVRICPYWSLSPDHEYQNNGYCSFLGEGDWESEGLSLLWNQCKECGINMDEDDDHPNITRT